MGVLVKCFAQTDENIHGYIQVQGIIDVRTDFSDGAHTLEYLMKLAMKRGIDVFFINDHDRKVLEYGIRPFQNILKKELKSPQSIREDQKIT